MDSEPDELTDAQLTELSAALRLLRKEIEEQIARADAGSRPVALDEPIGRLSRMEAIQQQQMTRAGRARNQRRLELIATAQERIDDGTYGWCTVCEEPIGYRRLKARPEWPICLACQAEREAN